MYVPPSHFVVFDRVRSIDAAFKKRWLLHTASEPEIDGDRFSASYQGGKLFGQTLLPESADVGKRGGRGEQFWSDGQNWPLPDKYNYSDEHPLFGQWRIETTPTDECEETHFLHLLRATDGTQTHFDSGELIRTASRRGVRFTGTDVTGE